MSTVCFSECIYSRFFCVDLIVSENREVMNGLRIKKVRGVLWLCCLIYGLPLCLIAEEPKQKGDIEIVLLNQFLTHIPWVDTFWDEYRAELREEFGDGVHFISEPIDIEQIENPKYLETLTAYLEQKYSDRDIDLFLLYKQLSPFVDAFRSSFIQDTPILFVNLHDEEEAISKVSEIDKALLLNIDFMPTIDLAFRLLPSTKEIFVVSGTGQDDLSCVKAIKEDAHLLPEGVKIHYIIGNGLDVTYRVSEKLPEDSIIVYTSYIRDRTNRLFDPLVFLRGLAEHANVPIFSNYTPHLGEGVVGGAMLSPEDAALQAVGLSMDVFERGNEVYSDRLFLEYKNRIDYKQIEKWEIKASRIPEGTLILNQELSFLERYRLEILGIFFVVALQAMLIAFLIRVLRREKKSKRALAYTHSVLRSIRHVDQAITNESDASDLIRRVCQILVKERGFPIASINLIGDLGRQVGDAFVYPEGLSAGLKVCLQEAVKEVVHEGNAQDSIQVFQKEVDVGSCLNEKNSKCLALVAPLNSMGNAYGSISVMLKLDGAHVREEIALFGEVANDLAFALSAFEVDRQRESMLKELFHEKEKAETASRTKDEFLTVVSHEMRTPLNPVIGYASLMLDEFKGTEYESYLVNILESSDRMVTLIDDILSFSQLQSDSIQTEMSEFCLYSSMIELILDMQTLPGASRIVFKNGSLPFVEPFDRELRVVTDFKMLRQLVSNLLNNACKYSSDGSIQMLVGINTHGEGEQVLHFEVIDYGIGIPNEMKRVIFDAFHQVDTSVRRAYEGIGLGLSICKKIVDLLGGRISVESVEGKGSRFSVDLPIQIGKNTKLLSEDNSTFPIQPISQREWSILVAEDQEDNATLISQCVRKLGGTVTIVRNGLEAVSASQVRAYDLIMMDLNMPQMDGIVAGQRIRLNVDNEKTPIIALTADCTQKSRERAKQSGFNDLLEKPIHYDTLANALKNHLNIRSDGE